MILRATVTSEKRTRIAGFSPVGFVWKAMLVLSVLHRKCECSGIHNTENKPTTSKGAEFNRVYSGYVNRGVEEIYSFNYTTKPEKVDAVRVYVSANSDDQHYPVIFVIRQQNGVLSWQVPLVLRGLYQRKYTYQEVGRTLCPLEPMQEERSSEQSMFIDVASMAPFDVRYELLVTRVNHFTLETGVMFNFSATPSQPRYFLYEFPDKADSVVIKVVSKRASPCTVVSVQDIWCPVYDQDHNVEFIGVYQSMTLKAAITVQRKDFPGGKFYVVFVIKPEDYTCGGSFPSTKGKGNQTWNQDRIKDLHVTIVPSINERVYVHAMLFSFVIFLFFFLGAVIIAFVHYVRLQRQELDGLYSPDDGTGMVAASHPLASSASEGGSYGAIDESSPAAPGSHSASPMDTARCRSYSDSSAEEDSDLDTLQDMACDKNVVTAKAYVYVSDLARKDSKIVSKKYKIYFWNITTISVFYALPVIQLVITYQTVVNVTGNQDICYYNFLCAHPLGVLSAFNNILSNVGYILLGFLFLLIVLRRNILHKRALEAKDIYAMDYGIPKHFGLFYTMAIALVMEGVLSACYHVCPNYSNFQFDTSFMYIIAGLCMLKLYQTRHPDINASAYFAYATFAVVILLTVLGVIFGKNATWFWILFSLIHVIASLTLSTQIYYMGRFKIDVSNADIGFFKRIVTVLYTDCIQQCNRPMYMDRMILLILGNLVNWSFAIFGLILKPKDFPSYLLGIFICNLLLYLAFYIIMKLRNSERLRPIPLFCIIATAVMWGAALYFFFQNLTSWEETPAESREQNRECILLNFFDDHDIWHFLSAAAMFFSFLVLLTLDDDLDYVRRDKIPVF
ncbi:SID1 transmembrane family member 1-like isoform X1 [Acipenser ruthenus]|uniref:SID1 transmembrane family member 1-like isoform X1 n=1 Tax=Acipenser ruthenus TaxID=7906 RepID=UPI00155F5E08|nr:SID1 transmembrane family member 1-like isoform X1 [Acipenser ruthenus]